MRLDSRFHSLLLPLLLTFSCSGSSTPPEDVPTVMEFAVVEALLGPPVTLADPPLSIRPPRDWAPLDSARRAQLDAMLQEHADPAFQIKPEQIFVDPATHSIMVLSTWTADSLTGWKDVQRSRRAGLARNLPGRQLSHESFLIGDQMCLQTLIQDSLIVNFKLLLANGVQLDYLVSRANYATQAELIESSIGSFVSRSTTQHQ